VRKRSNFLLLSVLVVTIVGGGWATTSIRSVVLDYFDQLTNRNSHSLVEHGRRTFRFDTFGDEQFWGSTLQLHKAIEGAQFGGVGPGISPATALALGLKVDLDDLSTSVVQALKAGNVIRA